jgi:hypothetical protein
MSSGAAVSSGAGSSRVVQVQPYEHCVTGVTVTNCSIIDEVHVACVLCSSAAWCMLYVQTSLTISTAQLLTVSIVVLQCVCTCTRSSRPLDCLSIVNSMYDSIMTLTNLPHHPTINTPLFVWH